MKNSQEISVWPLMVDVLSSILIIFIIFNFLDNILNPQKIEQVIVDIKRDTFVQKFDKEFQIEREKNQISRDGKFDYLKITFSDRVLFTSGDYRLGKNGKEILKKLAKLITVENEIKNMSNIQVEGHTDDLPLNKTVYPKDNWELSTARALSVVNYLSARPQNLPNHLFSANGYSSNVTIDKNDRSKNRRIEVKIFYSAD